MAKDTYISEIASASSVNSAAANRHSRRRDACSVRTPENEQALRWRHITMVLAACGGGEGGSSMVRMPRRAVVASGLLLRGCSGRNATIEILERPSPTSAVLSWRDPTGSSYGYQLWQKRIARWAGRCALTGFPIRRGDLVFRPSGASVRPANASAMILAIYIERPQPPAQRPESYARR
jgi:Domain of unknown function (DUF3331)